MVTREPSSPHLTGAPSGAESGREDPLARWDEQRRRCPVSREEVEGETRWIVHGHPEALQVLHDHETFSSRVSSHLSVPSGMDPPEHGPYRAIVDRYFDHASVGSFEGSCRQIAGEVIAAALARGSVEVQSELGEPCAVHWQCAFMGWPHSMREELTAWQKANERATRAGDRTATAAVAESFARRVATILEERRALGVEAPDDPTTHLLAESVDGRPLNDAEIVSIVRNWTVGELASIAASIGILVHALAQDQSLQARLRREPGLLPAAIDEVLRVRGPLVANRRVATRDTELGGQRIRRGDRLRILWPSVNRDERVFGDPDRLRLDRDTCDSLEAGPQARANVAERGLLAGRDSDNLLYGAGIHVCPGAPLARLELRVFVEELLGCCAGIALDPARPPRFAVPPQGGYERLYVRLAGG